MYNHEQQLVVQFPNVPLIIERVMLPKQTYLTVLPLFFLFILL